MNTFHHHHYMPQSGSWMGRRYPLHGCLSSQEDCCSILGDVNLRCIGSSLLSLRMYIRLFSSLLCARRKTIPTDADTVIVSLHLSSSSVVRVLYQAAKSSAMFSIPPSSALVLQCLRISPGMSTILNYCLNS